MVAQFDPKSGTVNLVSSKRQMQEVLPKNALVGDESIYVTDRATIDDPTESETIKVHPNYSDAGPGILQVFKNYAVGQYHTLFSVIDPFKTGSHIEYNVTGVCFRDEIVKFSVTRRFSQFYMLR